jgi:hypothetical protein
VAGVVSKTMPLKSQAIAPHTVTDSQIPSSQPAAVASQASPPVQEVERRSLTPVPPPQSQKEKKRKEMSVSPEVIDSSQPSQHRLSSQSQQPKKKKKRVAPSSVPATKVAGSRRPAGRGRRPNMNIMEMMRKVAHPSIDDNLDSTIDEVIDEVLAETPEASSPIEAPARVSDPDQESAAAVEETAGTKEPSSSA